MSRRVKKIFVLSILLILVIYYGLQFIDAHGTVPIKITFEKENCWVDFDKNEDINDFFGLSKVINDKKYNSWKITCSLNEKLIGLTVYPSSGILLPGKYQVSGIYHKTLTNGGSQTRRMVNATLEISQSIDLITNNIAGILTGEVRKIPISKG